jgi:drug/metabolite transporter (DMT)-like permease
MDNRLLTALLLLMTAVWGCTFTVVKDATTAYGVFSFLAVRFSIGLLCLSAFAWRNFEKKSFLAGLGIGIPLAMGYLLQTWGLKYTTPTNSGLITSFLVIAAPLFNRMLFGVRTRPVLWAAICLTMAGMLCLTGIGWSPLALGDSMTLGAAIAFGLQIALLDRYAKHFSALSVATGQTAAAAAIFLVAWPLTEPVCRPNGGVWTAILLTGIVATAGGFYVPCCSATFWPAIGSWAFRFSERFSCWPPSCWWKSCRSSCRESARQISRKLRPLYFLEKKTFRRIRPPRIGGTRRRAPRSPYARLPACAALRQ